METKGIANIKCFGGGLKRLHPWLKKSNYCWSCRKDLKCVMCLKKCRYESCRGKENVSKGEDQDIRTRREDYKVFCKESYLQGKKCLETERV